MIGASTLMDAGLGMIGGGPMLKLPKGLENIGQATKGMLNETRDRLGEFKTPLKIALVASGTAIGSLVGNQFVPATAGSRTPAGYYGEQALLAVPALAIGKLASDHFGGAPFMRALVLGTLANALMQLPALFSKDQGFNLASFLVKEAVLVPMSLLLVE